MKIIHAAAFLLLSLPLARAQDTPVPYPTDPTPVQPVQKPFAAPDVPKLGSTPVQKPNVGKLLPQAQAVSPIPRFRRDVLFRWNAPNGETMKAMLRQIEEAEKQVIQRPTTGSPKPTAHGRRNTSFAGPSPTTRRIHRPHPCAHR